MTNETVLTFEEIIAIGEQASSIESGLDGYILPFTFARDVEQAVLQSPEVQALRKDAERYKWLKKQFRIMSPDMGGNHSWVLQRPLRKGHSVDVVCDAAMEKKND